MRGKEQVFVGAVGGWVMHWSVDRLEREDTSFISPTPQTYLIIQLAYDAHEYELVDLVRSYEQWLP